LSFITVNKNCKVLILNQIIKVFKARRARDVVDDLILLIVIRALE